MKKSKRFDDVEGYLMTTVTILLVIDVILGILARFIHFEIVFATELGKYLFIWLCLIGISAAAKDNQHIRISFIVEKLPINPKYSWLLSQIIFLACSILFMYVGIRLTLMHFVMKKSVIGFDFPMFVFSAALPAGFFLTSIRLIENIWFYWKKQSINPWVMNQYSETGSTKENVPPERNNQ